MLFVWCHGLLSFKPLSSGRVFFSIIFSNWTITPVPDDDAIREPIKCNESINPFGEDTR